MPALATKQIEKKNSNQRKETNFVLVQNNKILVMFFSLQAKLQLFQQYLALFEKL